MDRIKRLRNAAYKKEKKNRRFLGEFHESWKKKRKDKQSAVGIRDTMRSDQMRRDKRDG